MMVLTFIIGFAIGLFCGGLLTLYTAYVLTSTPQSAPHWGVGKED